MSQKIGFLPTVDWNTIYELFSCEMQTRLDEMGLKLKGKQDLGRDFKEVKNLLSVKANE